MDFNSSKNQRIKREFVSQNVKAEVTSEVNFILDVCWQHPGDAPFTFGDIENFIVDNGGVIEDLESQIAEVQNKLEEARHYDDIARVDELEEELGDLETQVEELENIQGNEVQVMEWYKVTNEFLIELQQEGEVVIEDAKLWGRCCTGQYVYMDSLIDRICERLRILEGQDSEWSFC